MPSGSLVTGFSLRALPNGQTSRELIFWEKNGLRHGEVTLPEGNSRGLEVLGLEFSLDSSLLAVHCKSTSGKELVLIMYRSNWKWFCKQKVHLDSPLASLRWMFNKKQQLFLAQRDGRFDFIEYHLTYCTSGQYHNHREIPDLSYTAVVDNHVLNLTPLGKLLMPPPMSEKQVPLASEEPPTCLTMHGHTLVAVANGKLHVLDAATGAKQVFELPVEVNGREVYRVLAIRGGTVVLIENQLSAKDKVTVLRVGGALEVVKQMEVPKTYSACISAADHHSGYMGDRAKDQENLAYTTISAGNQPTKAEEISGGSPLFQLGGYGDDEGKL